MNELLSYFRAKREIKVLAKLGSYFRVFIIIAIIIGIPLGLAVFYLNNNFGQEGEVKDNLLLLPENQKIEKQKTEEERVREKSSGSEIIDETPEEKAKEIIPEEEQNTQELPAGETNPEAVYAPDFNFKDAKGSEMSLSDLKGNNILLVFWATWCGYCKKELPDLKNFVEKYGDEIIVLAISNQEPKETIQEYITQEKINFPVLIDGSGEIWNRYLVRGTPSHFLIDKEGRVVAAIPGYATKENLDALASIVIEK